MPDPRLSEILKTVNGRVLDRSIRHAVFLERLKTGEVNRIMGFLNSKVFPDVVWRTFNGLSNISTFHAGTVTTKRYLDLVSGISGIIRSGYRQMNGNLAGSLQDIAISEAQWLTSMMQSALPVEIEFVVPAPSILKKLVKSPLRVDRDKFLALNEWVDDLGRAMHRQVAGVIRSGIVEGQGIDRIVRRLRGTLASGFTDGVLEIGRRQAETVVRTSVQSVLNAANDAVYADNTDVIKGVQWMSTLDARTTDICASLDGQTFNVGEGPRPPMHYQCRSRTVPVMKSWKELGIDLKEPPRGPRAAKFYPEGADVSTRRRAIKNAMRGEVPGGMTYGSWLKQQPVDVQNQILGVGRAKLFRRGKVSLDRFVTKDYKPLTLKELEALEASMN